MDAGIRKRHRGRPGPAPAVLRPLCDPSNRLRVCLMRCVAAEVSKNYQVRRQYSVQLSENELVKKVRPGAAPAPCQATHSGAPDPGTSPVRWLYVPLGLPLLALSSASAPARDVRGPVHASEQPSACVVPCACVLAGAVSAGGRRACVQAHRTSAGAPGPGGGTGECGQAHGVHRIRDVSLAPTPGLPLSPCTLCPCPP